MQDHYRKLHELLQAGESFVSVWLVKTEGSTPHDEGGRMLVTEQGLFHGTVGGGRVESRVLEYAGKMLETGSEGETAFLDWSLNKDVGMTCGGRVKLYLELFNGIRWPIHIFGAGHVCQALVPLLAGLHASISVYDTRKEWLDKLPALPGVRGIPAANLVERAGNFTSKDFVLLMTMGHATDKPVLARILRGERPAYLGVIGSKSKRAVLTRELEAEGLDAKTREDFYCPMGLPLGSNRPGEIAVSITAQLLQVRDRNES